MKHLIPVPWLRPGLTIGHHWPAASDVRHWHHAMPILVLTMLLFAGVSSARADQLQFSNAVKASLVFRDDSNPSNHYPHLLQVFLRLENVHDSEVSWVANLVNWVDAELRDADGKAVPPSPGAGSILSSARPFRLPYGSRLDWLITHGGVSMRGDVTNQYALVIGGWGRLIPIATAGSYSLHLRLRGFPWTNSLLLDERVKPGLLLDLPPAKLEVTN